MLENQIQSLEEQREALIVELDTTRSRLSDFQQSQTDLDSAREELNHQQQLLRQNAGQEMQGFSFSSQAQSHHSLSSYGFIIIPISVFIGAYLLRRYFLRQWCCDSIIQS